MRLVILAMTVTLFAGIASADQVYRWKDANGQVHFSSQPPRNNAKAESIEVKGQPSLSGEAIESTQSATPLAQPAQPANDRIVQKEETLVSSSIDAKQAQENCRLATQYKQGLNENHSRRYQQKDGSYRPLSDTERAAQNAKMDDMIKRFCN